MSYKWTDYKRDKLAAILRDADINQFPCGAYCVAFIPLTKTAAVKLYVDPDVRNDCHALQKKSAKYKLAPKAGDTFEIAYPKGDIYTVNPGENLYGYLTEIAAKVNSTITSGLISKLRDRYSEIGISATDMCSFNMGKVRDQIVMIDFSGCYEEENEPELV